MAASPPRRCGAPGVHPTHATVRGLHAALQALAQCMLRGIQSASCCAECPIFGMPHIPSGGNRPAPHPPYPWPHLQGPDASRSAIVSNGSEWNQGRSYSSRELTQSGAPQIGPMAFLETMDPGSPLPLLPEGSTCTATWRAASHGARRCCPAMRSCAGSCAHSHTHALRRARACRAMCMTLCSVCMN